MFPNVQTLIHWIGVYAKSVLVWKWQIGLKPMGNHIEMMGISTVPETKVRQRWSTACQKAQLIPALTMFEILLPCKDVKNSAYHTFIKSDHLSYTYDS